MDQIPDIPVTFKGFQKTYEYPSLGYLSENGI